MAASESTLMRVVRWLLAALLLATGALKAVDPAATAQSIANYHLLPAALVPYAGLYVPWLEIAAAVALLFGRLRRGGWLLALLLSEAFLVFTVSALARGLDISCGCFGTGHRGSLPWMVALDAVMIAISLHGVRQTLKASPRER